MKPSTKPVDPELLTPKAEIPNPKSQIRISDFAFRISAVRGFRKYTKILRVALIERMTYRGDFFLATILRFLPMVTTILLWHAIYKGAEADEARPVQLAGY